MIVAFKDSGTENIFDGARTKPATKRCPETLCTVIDEAMISQHLAHRFN